MKIVASAVIFLTPLLVLNSLYSRAEDSVSRNIDLYRRALSLDPSDFTARYRLGVSLLQTGDYEGGVRELVKVYSGREDDPDLNFNIGYAYLKMGRNDDALLFFDRVLDLGGDHGKRYRLDAAYLNLGYNYKRSGDEEKSILCYERALQVDPENRRAYMLLAGLLAEKGKNERAVEILERVSYSVRDEELLKLSAAVYSRLGVDYLERKEYGEARKTFLKVLGMDSSHLYAGYYLGYLDYLEGNLDEAAERLGMLASLKVEDESLKKGLKSLLYNIGVRYLQEGRPGKAQQALNGLIDLYPDFAKARFLAGTAAMEAGDYDGAVGLLEEYVKLEPSDAAAATRLALAYEKAGEMHFARGKELYDKGMLRESLAEFRRVLDIFPNHRAGKYLEAVLADMEKVKREEDERTRRIVDSLLAEGKALLDEGELLAARRKLNEAVDLDPDREDVRRVMNRCLKKIESEIEKNMAEGTGYLGKGNYYTAVKSFSRVLYYDPDNQVAAEEIKRAEKRMSAAVAPILARAGKLMKDERFREAAVEYGRALKINPDDETALAGLDRAKKNVERFFKEYISTARDYAAVSQFALAMEYYRKALALKPGVESVLQEMAALRRKEGRMKGISELLKEADRSLSSGRYNKAIAAFEAVLNSDPDNAIARDGLAKARSEKKAKIESMITDAESLLKEERFREAMELSRGILDLDGGNGRAKKLVAEASGKMEELVNPHVTAGKDLFEKGNIDGAVIEFSKALARDPGNPVAKRYLSRVDSLHVRKVVNREVKRRYLSGLEAYTMERYEEALREWGDVLELEPHHDKALLNIEKARRKLAAIRGD